MSTIAFPRMHKGIPVMASVTEFPTSNWVDLEARARRTDLALVPLGAVEVYGPHMPQGTDGIVALALCRQLATRIDALIAPLIPVGYSAALDAFPSTLSVPPEALAAYTRGIVDSLLKLGVRRVLFVNGHAGNVPVIDALSHDRAQPGRRFAQIDVWRFVQPLCEDLLGSERWKFGHAGETMTSVMLHLYPEYVQMDRATKSEPAGPGRPLGLSGPRSYREYVPTGLLGDATLATAEKGEKIVGRVVDALEEFVRSPEFAVEEDQTGAGSEPAATSRPAIAR